MSQVDFIDVTESAAPALDIFGRNQIAKLQADVASADRRSREKQADEANKLAVSEAEKQRESTEKLQRGQAATQLRIQELQNKGFEKLNESRAAISQQESEARATEGEKQREFAREMSEADRKQEEEDIERLGSIRREQLTIEAQKQAVTATTLAKFQQDRDAIRTESKQIQERQGVLNTVSLLTNENATKFVEDMAEQTAARIVADTNSAIQVQQQAVESFNVLMFNEAGEQPGSAGTPFRRPFSLPKEAAFASPERLTKRMTEVDSAFNKQYKRVLDLRMAANRHDPNTPLHKTLIENADKALGQLLQAEGANRTVYALMSQVGTSAKSHANERAKTGEKVTDLDRRAVDTLRELQRGSDDVLDMLEDRNVAPGKDFDTDEIGMVATLAAVVDDALISIVDSGQFNNEALIRQTVQDRFDFSEEVEKQMADKLVERLQRMGKNLAESRELAARQTGLQLDVLRAEEAAEQKAVEAAAGFTEEFLGEVSDFDLGLLGGGG